MSIIEPAVKTTDELLLWFLGYFAQKFRQHAIVKGGMVLRLMNSPRATNDLDILFVPFSSKSEILPELKLALSEVEGIESKVIADSKCIRCLVRYGKIQIQIEGTIAESCEYESISAISQGIPILLAIQRRDIALAHKIGAWNERHLMRDLYDIYFFISVLGVLPHMDTLKERLGKVFSGRTNRSKVMDVSDLSHELEKASSSLTAALLDAELSALLSKRDLAGLDLKIKVALHKLIGHLVSSKD